MNAKAYAFQVGQFECFVLLEGASVIGAEGMLRRFPDAGTEADYRQAYADMGLSLDEADNSMNILLAKVGDERLLVDTGMGGLLLESLQLVGHTPEDITLVVLTHTHGDHVLGLLNSDGEPTFPNARYVISAVELAFWQARIDDGVPDQRAIVDMLLARGLQQIDMDAEILPGLRALPIPGHTPGQIALRFEADGETLIHQADLLHSPMQFAHPEWSPRFDADTGASVRMRRAALEQAADNKLLLLFYHLTFPGLGYVQRAGSGYRWGRVTD